ncbi:MAG: fimbrial assembly protein, partial [Pseudomonadota bacterium]
MKTFQPLILILFSLFSFIHHKTLYAESLVLSNKTLFLGQQEPALSMLVMSRNHKLFYEAYNDVSDLDGDGILDIRYRPSLGSHNDNPNDSSSYNDNYYYGLFDSRLCYHYDGQKFTPRGIANNKRCIGSNDSYWSGDFLNYLTTSRMDAIRKVLYGGKRYEDTSSRTILERAYIPQDGHSWAKEYTSVSVDGYDITDFTPLNQPLSGRRHLFGNLTPATNDPINIPGPPLLRILINSPHRVWEWASIERPVLGNSCNNLQSQRVSCFAEKNTERAEYYVRVEACKSPDSNFVLNPDECKAYPNGNFKPIGQLQKKGETEEQLFGLITGSYDTNLSGGVLRKNISSFADEVDESTGVFTAISGIVKTLDRIRVIDFTSNEFKHDCLDDNLRSPLTETGKCSIWGNPIAEMMYESLRYFAGAASPTPAFSRASSKDNSLQLPKPTWLNPYDEESTGIGHCARANQIVISDIYPNFDTDQLPGVYGWGQSYDSAGVNPGTSTLSSLNVVNEANAITSQEPGITNSERYIGQSQTLYDGAPTGKRVQSLGSVRGLSPEEPTKRGGYYSASIAKFGWEQDISEAKDKQNVKSIAVVLESPVPKIEIPISGKLVTLIPFGKTVGGCIGIQPDGDYQPTNTILDVYVESFSSTSGKFRINFEDVEQGNDHEMDAIVEYIYEVEGNNLRITLNSVYGAGNCVQHIGYVISGTTTDGTYLDVRDVSFSNDDVDYILDTPPGGNYKDGKPLPYFSTREFTADFSSNETATLLKDPLWYAAKWGGYETVTQNNVDRMVWDTNNDTNPDNYFLVTNMLSLPRQLEQAFQSTITDVPAMSSVAFDSTRLTDDTLIYRASFQPQNWHGEILAYNANTAITQDTIQANWTASETLSKQASSNSRNIYTFRPDTQQGIPF